MNAREEERKQLLQACMAVVKKEDSKARRRPETREKPGPKKKPQTPSTSSQNKSLSMSSSISKPTLTKTTSSLPKKMVPVIKNNSASVDARKARPTDSNRKSSTDAEKRPKQPAATKPKSVKSKTPTPISVSEVSGASNTLDNIPDSLQPISESTGTATFTGEDQIEVEEVEELPSQASKSTSGGSLSIKSILKTISSMHTLPTSAPSETKSTEPQSDSLKKSEKTSSAGTSSVVRKGILKTRTARNLDASQLTYTSEEISREKPNSATGHNLYYTEEEYIPKPGNRTAKRLSKSKSLRNLGIEDFPEVFMSRLSDPKRPPSASSALSVSSNRLRSIKSSYSQKGLPRKEKKKAGTSAARDNEIKLAVAVPNNKDKRAMSLKDIVVAEKKKFDARNKRSSMYSKKSSKSRLLDTEPSQEFVSALKSELKSIQENFIAVTDAEQPPVPFTDKFRRENLMLGKREPSTLPKYDIPLPDIEHPYVPPPPFKCAPGINYTPFPQRPIVHQPYYGQPYYDPSGRVLEPEEIGPVGRFVSEILASNVRLVDAAMTAAREMGQLDGPAAQRLLEQFRRRQPMQTVVRLISTDIDTTQLQAEMADEKEEFERQARSNMEMERLASERLRLERREERREREEGILEFDPEAMKHEHRRLEQDKERRNRERERLSRARERWEDERMEHERKRLEREENLARERKAEEAALALQRKEEEDRAERRSRRQSKSGHGKH